jgi:hypothetical protein
MAKKQEVAVQSEDILAQLGEAFPAPEIAPKIILPRLGMFSQDVTKKVGKKIEVLHEEGTFYTERESEEKNDEGKFVWEKEEIGEEADVIILFKRKQLQMYDEATEEYTSSPVYDTDEEEVPLFCDRKEVNRGNPKDLIAEYQYTDKDGKVKSKLSEDTILYVKYEGEIYQLNLRGSSKWSFSNYQRDLRGKPVPSVVTHMVGEHQEKGKITWSKILFSEARELSNKELVEVLADVERIKNTIAVEKKQFQSIKKVGGKVESKELPSGDEPDANDIKF